MVPTQFTHISVQDGLSQITVADIAEDSIGFMWFATQNGVNRFDGYNFVQYKKDKHLDGSGPKGDFVYKLAVDKVSGDIWMASSSGLSRYQQHSDSFIHHPLIDSNGEQHHFVATVVYDHMGQLWAGTNLGLFKFEPATNSFKHVKFPNDMHFRIQDIVLDSNGALWLATSKGLYRYKAGEPLYSVADLENVEITDIESINDDQIWFSTNGKGIYVKIKDDGDKYQVTPLTTVSLSFTGRSIYSMKQIANGDIWISTLDGLTITKLEDNPISIDLKHNAGTSSLLSASHMTRTYESRSGLIWQGTWTAGFSMFDPNSLQFNTLNAGASDTTRGVTNDDKGNIWFGTPEGLWRRDQSGNIAGPWTFDNEPNGPRFLEENQIMSVAYASKTNKLWIGTRSGLAVLTEGSTHISYVEHTRGNFVYTLSTDKNGDVWLGDFNNGLIQVDGESHETLNQWQMASITKILVDDNDTHIWAGTMEGLIRVNKHTQETLDLYDVNRENNRRSPRVVTWISKSSQDFYWIGAQGSGVMQLLSDIKGDYIFKQVAAESHLSTLSIGGIEEDRNGNIWASTTEGIAKLDSTLIDPEYFSGKNGAKNEGYYINNSVTNTDGEILFGSPTGITYFKPENIKQSDWHPPVVFTQLSVLNNPITVGNTGEHSPLDAPVYLADKIVLQPEDNVVSIEFSALDLSAPEKNQYKYKLEGFDSNWNTTLSKNRVATYTNLDAGSYNLIVKATNKDGVWSDHQANITITVVPPWWLTTPAKILWIVFVLALLISFYRRRVYDLKKRSDLLAIQVEERTAELEKMNKKLLRLSAIDDLTSLRNRRDFRTNAMQEISRFERGGKPFCILLVDIDFFKQVNDINGHACGDKVLVETSALMKKHVRQQDLLARWGGEEFIALIVETSLEQGKLVAEKIRSAVYENVVEFDNQEIRVSVTIGVSEIEPNENLDDCINRADQNLYLGKKTGRNTTMSKSESYDC